MGRRVTLNPVTVRATMLVIAAVGCGPPVPASASDVPPGMCTGEAADAVGAGSTFAVPGSRVLDPACLVSVDRLPTDAVLVDVRPEHDFAALSAPGSINLAPAAVAGRRFLRDRSPVLVGWGGRYRELEALCLELRAQGVSRALVLWNGLRALDGAGRLEGDPAGRVRSQTLTAEEFLHERHYRHWRIAVPDGVLSARWLDDLLATVGAGEQVLVLASGVSDAAVFSQWVNRTAAHGLYLLAGGREALDRAQALHEAARMARADTVRGGRRCPLTQ